MRKDYGCTTFLLADDTPGSLQVLSKDGKWIDADMIKGLSPGPLRDEG
jgi:isopenicillin N synthase-like dioxygenase